MSLCFFVFMAIGVAIVLLVSNLAGGSHASLARSGRPARGILLEVSSTAVRVATGTSTVGSYAVERRQALIDVELPGQAPVEVRVQLLVPVNLSALVLPGATVELRVHPKTLKTIAVVGPGTGFALAPAGALPSTPVRPS